MKTVCAIKYFKKPNISYHYTRKNMFYIIYNQLLHNTSTDKKEKYV